MKTELTDRLKIVRGDITQLDVDVIVTAANSELRGGGGVDGAVHRGAGKELLAACRPLAPCPTGEARITPGFDLPSKYVIHAVGPIYGEYPLGEASRLLASAYTSSLTLAEESVAKSIAFPCISTGVYGFPQDEAAIIAFDAAVAWCRSHPLPETITFCCFGDADEQRYLQQIQQLGS